MKRLVIVLALVLALAAGVLTYCYFHPAVRLGVFEPVDPAGDYVERPALAYGSYFGLPLPPGLRRDIEEFGRANEAVVRELYEEYDRPCQVSCAVELRGGQTVVTYGGTVTDKTGAPRDYSRQLVFDFILTRNISG